MVALAAGRAHAQEEARDRAEVRTVARIVATGGIGGHLAEPVCSGEVDFTEAPFGHVAPRLVIAKESEDRPFVFDTGGLLTPGGVARFAVAHAPLELAFTLDALGYRALTFGSGELAAPRSPMLRALGAIRGRGIPTVATNLFCDDRALALCEALVDGSDGPSLHPVGDRTLAFLAFLPEDAIARVAPDRAIGLRIAPIGESIANAVRRARAAGANLVVASLDPGAGANATARVLAIADALPPDARPDVMFTSRGADNMLFARPAGFEPAIVGASPTQAVRVRVRESPLGAPYDVLAQALAPSRTLSPVYEPFVEELGEQYCREWGRTLAGATLDRPLDGTSMLELTAGVMRTVTEAEVAILNRGILDARWQPARDGAITASDVYVAIQYDEPVMIAEVEGEWLKQVAERADAAGLVALGIEKSGNDLLIDGRPLEPRGEYRVATIRFLASGGDGALPRGPAWARAPRDTTLRSALLSYLEGRRLWDPRDTLYLPGDELAWTVRASTDATFAGSAVHNPSAYGSITQTDSISVGLDGTLRGDGLSRWWGWENEATLRYRTTRVPRSDFVETEDRWGGRSTLLYRGLRVDSARWYVPEPFVEGWLESELTVPDESEFRHFLVRPTAGFRFSLTQHLKLKLSAGFEYEVFDPNGAVAPGGGAQLRIEPIDLLAEDRRKVHIELSADYFITTESHTLRFFFDTAIDLAEPVQLVCRFDLLARDDFADDARFGVGAAVSAGFRIRWLERVGP